MAHGEHISQAGASNLLINVPERDQPKALEGRAVALGLPKLKSAREGLAQRGERRGVPAVKPVAGVEQFARPWVGQFGWPPASSRKALPGICPLNCRPRQSWGIAQRYSSFQRAAWATSCVSRSAWRVT
jgi:hypothetical protein